jgi:hypothetical protein
VSRACNRRSAPSRSSRPWPLAGLAILILLTAAAGPAKAAPPPAPPPAAGLGLSPGDLARAAAGEVVVRLERVPGSGPRQGLGVAAVDEPPARVFAALADFAHWSEFMPFMSRSEARREADGSFLCSQSLALPTGERHYQIRAQIRAQIRTQIRAQAAAAAEGSGEGAAWSVTWSYVPGSGDIAAQRGSWTLLPLAGGRTLAVLRLVSDPGGLSAWLSDRAMTKSIPWIFNGLRQQVQRDRYAAAGGSVTR